MPNLTSRIFQMRGKVARRRGNLAACAVHFRAASQISPSDAELASQYAAAAMKVGNLEGAIEGLTRALGISPERADWWYRLGFAHERGKDWPSAVEAYQRAQHYSPHDGRPAYHHALCLEAANEPELAIAQFKLSAQLGHRPADSYEKIFRLSSKRPLWQRYAILSEGAEFRVADRGWLINQARSATALHRHAEAVVAYESAREMAELRGREEIDYALALLDAGVRNRSMAVLEKVAKAGDKRLKILGAGGILLDRGRWSEAIRVLSDRWHAAAASNRAEIAFSIGHAYDRQYLWDQAADWYVKSLASDPNVPYRHYRYGVTMERKGCLAEALDAYAQAVTMSPSTKHWWFRLGEVAQKNGDASLAIAAYGNSLGARKPLAPRVLGGTVSGEPPELKADDPLREAAHHHQMRVLLRAVETTPTDPSAWDALAHAARDAGDFALEAQARVAALERVPDADNARILDSARAYIQVNDDVGEAVNILRRSRDFTFPDGLDLKRYVSTPEKRRRALFAEYLSTLPIAENVVLFESNHGASIGCHPFALYRAMSNDPRFDGFTYVWAYAKGVRIPREVEMRADTILAPIHSDLYLRHLASARYVINNVSFAPYYVRRDGQAYLNTWHGTPMKTLGRSMKQGVFEHHNLARNFVQASHLMAPNELTRWALIEDHGIDSYYTGEARIVGSPRLDRLVVEGDSLRASLRARLGIRDSEYVVLYAPTWRGGVENPTADRDSLVADLRTMGSVPGVRLLFRAHRLSEALVSDLDLPATVVPSDIDTSDLLAVVDTLVTDYSSIAFDFLVTGRRLVLYVPDEAEYRDSRGLYLGPDDLPATVCSSLDQLSSALSDLADPVEEARYRTAVELFAPMEDGHSSTRCLDFLLDEAVPREDARPLIVFHASLIPNGIASAFLALVEALDPKRFRIVLIVEAEVLRRDEGRLEMVLRLPEYVNLAFRMGNVTATPEEQWAMARSTSFDVSATPAIDSLISRAWERESRRVLGACTPAVAVEFDGYASLWANLMARVGGVNTRRLIWQHNQLADEYQMKFPELADTFALYRLYDAVCAVSRALAEENVASFESELGIDLRGNIASVPNVIPTATIIAKAGGELEGVSEVEVQSARPLVLCVGRMSPEKNHELLVRAWRRVIDEAPGARLFLVGQGPSEPELRALVESLGLTESIRFLGQVQNPYPLMSRAALLVLPSLHEGQPVVLFEAMALGIPLAATPAPGSVEAMELGYGYQLSTSEAEMSEQLVRLIQDQRPACGSVDVASLSSAALKAFLEVAGLR